MDYGFIEAKDPLHGIGLSDRTMNLISSALRLSTRKQYLGHIKKWGIYCLDNNLDQKAKNILAVLEF